MKHIFTHNIYILVLLAFVAGFTSCNNENSGYIGEDIKLPTGNKYLSGVSVERHISKAEIIANLDNYLPELNIASSPIAAFINKDIDVSVITYITKGVDGKSVIASGVVAIPAGVTSYDHLLSIQHGTLDIEEAPSHKLFYYEMIPVIGNHIVVMADYLGYGVSQTPDRQHPYLHVKSTGIVCADMIEATREYLHEKGIREMNDKIDLIGYSQGGTSTMATLFEIEARGQSSRIREVHAGGGAYDLVGTMQSFINGGMDEYPRIGYIPFIIRGISYGEQITLNDKNIYAPEFIKNGFTVMLATKPLSEWHVPMGRNIRNVINSDFFAPPTFNRNIDVLKLISALNKNSLTNYNTPATPVNLYHSRLDDFVPYSNAVAANKKWSNSTLIDLTMKGHSAAGIEFILRYMQLWSLVQDLIKNTQTN
ncbi:MAG: lipase family protein [Bacteroidales bacterium]